MSPAMELGSTPVRVGAYLAGLGVVFAGALGVGNLAGPVGEPAAHADTGHAGPRESGSAHAEEPAATDELPGGLMSSQDGYTLTLDRPTRPAGEDVEVRFTVAGPDDHPVTAYDVAHEKKLHLIAVRRDQTGFQHVHPRLTEDGSWKAALDLTPGTWRLFADFVPTAGEPLTLGTDLEVPGSYQPVVTAQDNRVALVHGYTVALDGDLAAGESDLLLRVEKDGRPVTDLEPYLGASGHLVALRAGDLAYLHVHPHEEAPGGGPEIRFIASVPSTGRYHLYLDFKHEGEVRTAAFAVTAGAGNDAKPDEGGGHEDEGSQSHGH